MIRLYRNVAWFVVGFCLSAFSLLSFAESQPATFVAATPSTTGSKPWSGVGCVSFTAACPTYNEALHGCTSNCNSYHSNGTENCFKDSNNTFAFAPVTCTINSVPAHYECPSTGGWTLEGQTCTRPDCVAPQTRQPNGSCMNQCPSAGTSTAGVTGSPFGGTGTMPQTLCINGCGYDWGSVAVQAGNTWAATAAKSLGTACSTSAIGSNGTPSSNSPPSDPQPSAAKSCIDSGQGFGTVNGVVVCSGPASTTQTKTTSTQTTTKPDGSTGTTQSVSTTTCTGAGACSTTTTTNNSGGGSGSGGQPNGTTTTQTEQQKAQYCATNISDPLCKPKSDDFCDKNPDAAGCKELGTPGEEGALNSQSNSLSSITPVSVASNATCPAAIPLPKGMSFDFAPICMWAEGLRLVVLALAWLAAGLIVLGVSM